MHTIWMIHLLHHRQAATKCGECYYLTQVNWDVFTCMTDSKYKVTPIPVVTTKLCGMHRTWLK